MGSLSSKLARGTATIGTPRKYPTKPTLPLSVPKSSIKSTTTTQLPTSFERKVTTSSFHPPPLPLLKTPSSRSCRLSLPSLRPAPRVYLGLTMGLVDVGGFF